MIRSDVDARSVAVIGMACRLPGASGTDALWALLRGGVDATSETPPERYDVDALHSPAPKPGRIASRRAGYLDDAAGFDAGFFGMSSTEATELDPQQRLLLMTAYEALEDAGQRPDHLAGSRTGVFVGNARADYLELALRQGLEGATAAQLNNFRSLLPARLSHTFDFRGPSVVVDTACSSALVAVHQAVQSLRAGETPLALAAAVNLALRPDEGVVMSQAGGMAPDGRSKFGDARADGHAPSDAVAVVVLKRLGDALADGDRIRAVVRGSAVGNDGRTSDSVLNPSLAGQLSVLRWAYEDAGVDPAEVDFVEAHGSGSPALDPLELTALGEVLGAGRPADRPLLVGSVKTNIGHAEAAGGMAGLIKAVLCPGSRGRRCRWRCRASCATCRSWAVPPSPVCPARARPRSTPTWCCARPSLPRPRPRRIPAPRCCWCSPRAVLRRSRRSPGRTRTTSGPGGRDRGTRCATSATAPPPAASTTSTGWRSSAPRTRR
jgi:acyl transferase domain-containing protein